MTRAIVFTVGMFVSMGSAAAQNTSVYTSAKSTSCRTIKADSEGAGFYRSLSSTKTTPYLMVLKLDKLSACVTDIVKPGPKQREEAQRLADQRLGEGPRSCPAGVAALC